MPATRGRHRRTDRARTVAQSLVLALVVAGTTAFASLHKSVTLDVDGHATTVSAFGRTVGDVLAAQGVDVGERDLVSPAPGALVTDGSEIVVRTGRQVVVEIDGEQRAVWSTALTVDEVLVELGLRGELRTSASRGDGVGRDVLRVSTRKVVHVAADGATVELATSATTVREVLAEAGVVLGEHDRVSVSLDAAAVDGLVVKVDRVSEVTRSETVEQPFEEVVEEDAQLAKGQRVVAQQGSPGVKVVTFVAYEVDGTEIGRTLLAESVLSAPVPQVVRLGTYEAPPTPVGPAVEPGTARAIGLEMMLARGWPESEWSCLDALWTKESGWRVTAENRSSGAYGIPQSLPGSKMATAGDDWRTNPVTQISWGLSYIDGRYGSPCAAWAHSQARNWY